MEEDMDPYLMNARQVWEAQSKTRNRLCRWWMAFTLVAVGGLALSQLIVAAAKMAWEG